MERIYTLNGEIVSLDEILDYLQDELENDNDTTKWKPLKIDFTDEDDYYNVYEAYEYYLTEFNNEHEKGDSPVCFSEFANNEWQDTEIKEYYINKLRAVYYTNKNKGEQ